MGREPEKRFCAGCYFKLPVWVHPEVGFFYSASGRILDGEPLVLFDRSDRSHLDPPPVKSGPLLPITS